MASRPARTSTGRAEDYVIQGHPDLTDHVSTVTQDASVDYALAVSSRRPGHPLACHSRTNTSPPSLITSACQGMQCSHGQIPCGVPSSSSAARSTELSIAPSLTIGLRLPRIDIPGPLQRVRRSLAPPTTSSASAKVLTARDVRG